MTDKIKVWKCEECGQPTMCFKKCGNKPDSCNVNQGPLSDPSNWQPTTDYEITERTTHAQQAPDSDWGDKSKMSGLVDENKLYGGHVGPHPPNRRVKIIWSEVTAENVHIAAELKNWDSVIDSKTTAIGHGGEKVINISDIPPTWLEDIEPAGPVQPGDIVNQYLHDNDIHIESDFNEWSRHKLFSAFLDIAKLSEQNALLRHTETTTYEDWSNHMYPDWTPAQIAYGRIVWNACLAAHNQPETKP